MKRCRHEHNSRLLVAAVDHVPVHLDCADVDAAVEFDINAAANSYCKAGFVDTEITDAEDWSQLRAVNVDFLSGYSEQSVRKGLESWRPPIIGMPAATSI